MRLRLAVLVIGLWFFTPNLVRGDELYTFSADYSSNPNLLPDSTVQWQFEVPSLLTAPTTITSFLSASLGSGFSGCGSISDVQIPLISPFNPPYVSMLVTDFTSSCGSNQDTGAGAQFEQSITSEGVFDAWGHVTGTVIGTLTITPVPEPSAMFLLSTGILALLAFSMLRSRYSRHRSALHSTAVPVQDLTV
jgi:hypothetical protein